MKKTVLQITQDILNDLTSDKVNSIDDTEESEQVAAIVQSTFEAIIAGKNWPHTKRIVHLVAYSNTARPTHMTIDESIKEMVSVYYNKQRDGETRLRYDEIKWKEPDEFLRLINARNSDDATVQTVSDVTGVQLLILNNKAPTYYTSFDDVTMVFDSFDNTVDNTLQASKTQARAYVIPQFEMTDDYVPDLPEEAFPLLIEEAKSRAAAKLNQLPDQKSEQESQRQRRWQSRKDWTINGGIKYPNYGRARHRGPVSDPTFTQDRE